MSKIVIAAAATLGLSAVAPAEVVAKKPYQLQVTTPCDPHSFCEVVFPVLTERVLVRHVSCVIAATSLLIVDVISRNGDGSPFGIEHPQPVAVAGLSGSGVPQNK